MFSNVVNVQCKPVEHMLNLVTFLLHGAYLCHFPSIQVFLRKKIIFVNDLSASLSTFILTYLETCFLQKHLMSKVTFILNPLNGVH